MDFKISVTGFQRDGDARHIDGAQAVDQVVAVLVGLAPLAKARLVMEGAAALDDCVGGEFRDGNAS